MSKLSRMGGIRTLGISVLLLTLAIYVRCADGPTCVRCLHERSPDRCYGQLRCSSDEMCYASVSSSGYSAGCRVSQYCREGTFLVFFVEYTQYCCSKDMCNRKLIQTLSSLQTTTKRPHPTPPTEPPTTEAPAFILSEGVNCDVCSGELCGSTGKVYSIKCPNGFPYCMNVVQNDASGNKLVYKRCASIDECKQTSHFLENTANHAQCNTFDPAEIYVSTFECSYCCETSFCNKNIIPPTETRVLGTRK